MTVPLPDVIRRYFELDPHHDVERFVALFSDDATVIDEGETHHGTAEIHAWRTGPATRYIYTTEVLDAERFSEDRFLVTGRLTGNFPGGTADLKWHFAVVDERISRLLIAP